VPLQTYHRLKDVDLWPASWVVITRQEEGEAVLILDIGYQSASCIFWEDHMVQAAFGITMSTSQLTRDIAYSEGR
jgi:cell division ATPase FtsA